MLVTTLTVALGTVSATALAEDDVTLAGGTQVTAFASEGDIDGGIAVEAQAEQTAPEAATTDAEATTPEATVPEADTTDAEAIVPEEVAPEATAPEVEQAEQTAPEAIVPEEVAPEATAPEADTTVKDEVSTKATAPTINATASSTTFDGTQDIVVTFTITSEGAFEVGGDIPLLGGGTCNATYEKVSDTEHRFTIPAQALKNRVEGSAMKDGQTLVFHTGYGVSVGEWGTDSYQYVDFPDVTLTYDSGAGDNGNGETPEKPENPDPENPDNGNGDNGDNNNGGDNNGETPEKPENPDPENPDNGNGDGETPENPDNGNGDNNNGGDNGDNQKPENPDNGNGDNQKPDGDNSETPDDNKDVQDWMTLTPAQKVTTTTQTQTPQTQTVSTTQTAPKTGDAASTLPLLGTGLTSLGVALGAIFKKRR